QEVGHAAVRGGADSAVGGGEEGLFGGDPEITGEGQGEACPGGGPVDCGQHRIGDATKVDDPLVERLGAAPYLRREVDVVVFDSVAEPGDVATCAEGAARAGHDQRPDRRPVGAPGESHEQLADHLGAHRVEGIGAVECQRPDLAVDLDPQR